MKIFILIVFGLATIRTIVPLAKKVDLSSFLFAVVHIVAYAFLLKAFLIFKSITN